MTTIIKYDLPGIHGLFGTDGFNAEISIITTNNK